MRDVAALKDWFDVVTHLVSSVRIVVVVVVIVVRFGIRGLCVRVFMVD